MGRHEIRLRRKKMTSRRIDSHKNYSDLLKKHERTGMWKKLLKLIIYIIIIFGIILIGYYGLRKLEKKQSRGADKQAQVVHQINNKTSRPGELTEVSLNTKNYGKA